MNKKNMLAVWKMCVGGGGDDGGEVYKKFITFYLADFGIEH